MGVFTIEMGQCYTLNDIPETHRDLLEGCYPQGRCDEDVKAAAPSFTVDNFEALKEYLKAYGAWNDEELSDDDDNLERLLWLMAGDLKEQGEVFLAE